MHPRFLLITLTLLLSIPAARGVEAEGVTEDRTSKHTLKPYDRKADTMPADSAEAAKKGFRRAKIPAGFKADLWATEPLLANPVAFSFDGQGRMYVAETHRYRTSVLDIRHYMFMLEDDLANRNQADWERSIKKSFPDDWQKLGVESEVVRLVEDSNGDGTADKSSVYADGFHSILDGIASGVLARPDGVWLTNIPGLYKLTGKRPDGKAEKKEEVFRGFGVRFNYTGHDLHGLIKGPDGRLYFSIGDRGASVKTKEGNTIEVPDEGAIFRCEEDGSHLELVMRGLRNPQELAFDDYGNLFTCDNDSDQGDRERLVYVVEGGDAGWRIGYQHCPQPAERNPWLAEHMWEPRDPAKNQPAYILSPVANLPDGPGGLVHYPGTGLPDKYNGCFFLACYKGTSATSQVAVFKPVPDGAGFKLEMLETFIPGCQATDVDFGPDSRMYVSFWDEGWERTAQGRIMKVEHEEARKAQTAQIAEVQKLLGEGMKQRKSDELVKLLGHKDQRVRLEAQWELASRPDGLGKISEVIQRGSNLMARWHAMMALSQLIRTGTTNAAGVWQSQALLDSDFASWSTQSKMPEALRVQLIRAWDVTERGAMRKHLNKWLIRQLAKTEPPAVRAAAAFALRRNGDLPALESLMEAVREMPDGDPYLRHAIVMGLSGILQRYQHSLTTLSPAWDQRTSAEQMVLLLAMEKAGVPGVPQLNVKGDRTLLNESARIASFSSDPETLFSLAQLIVTGEDLDEMTALRSINAAFRLQRYGNATDIKSWISREFRQKRSVALRTEAVRLLSLSAQKPGRDQVTGLQAKWYEGEGIAEVRLALEYAMEGLLASEDSVVEAALDAARKVRTPQSAKHFAALSLQADSTPAIRATALHVLSDLQSPLLPDVLKKAIADPSSAVRIAAAGLLGKTDPALAAKGLSAALADGSPEDHRAAFTELGALTSPEADKLLADHLTLLTAGKVPAIARLELIEAAKKREAPAVKEALAAYEASLPKDDFLAKYAVSLEGGDVENGKRLFKEHPVAACQRCHQVNKAGGEAGPPLDGIASRKDRRYLLESIVNPYAQIAVTFRMVVCTMKDGSIQAGVIQSETTAILTLQQPGDQPVTLNTADIAKREPVPSGMLPGMGELLTPRELRDLVEYCASLKADP